jgi:hypothetical protein
MSDRDDAAAAYYEDPEHRRLTGRGRKRSGQVPRLSTHVPVRLSATVIERVKEIAAEDGKTVSSWIRDVIDQEILRRERSRTVGVAAIVRWEHRPIPSPDSGTIASSAEDIGELAELAS